MLWVEHAHQNLGAETSSALDVGNRAVRTFQTQEQVLVILVSCPEGGTRAQQIAEKLVAILEPGTSLDSVVETVLASLPQEEHVAISILHVLGGNQAHLVECDAPPLFLTRRGRLVLLPVLEEVVYGRLVRQCRFSLQEGDHLAIVSQGYIQAKGWDRRWGWRDIALSIKRLTDTGGDAEQLLGALVRIYHQLSHGEPQRAVTVIAMYVRPLRSVTVWSGPPADPALDREALGKLMAGPGKRIICGGSTAEIAARVLGDELEVESRPADGWAQVPPVSRLKGVDLVTEGVVTLRKVCERIAGVQRARDLPRLDDGATRLARLLLEADVIHLIIGRAVNPAQTDGQVSWRQSVIEELLGDLRARGKIVSVEHVGVRSD